MKHIYNSQSIFYIVPSGSPLNFTISSVTSRTLTLSWYPPLPSQRNGVIISYLITCSSGDSIINSTQTSNTSLTITGLQPFTNYTCTVSAATIVGDGPAATNSTMTNEDSRLLIFYSLLLHHYFRARNFCFKFYFVK